ATQAGVMVVNAPTSNITSAAELAVGLLLATARNIAPANQALKGGAWKRSKYGGVELLDKKVGVVGFGRIGQLVAERLKGFGMEILAYDPYVSAQRAGQLGAQLVTLDELLEQSDFITVHLPKSPETLGLLGKEALAKVKPTVRIINAARGGIVDEEALAEALREGRVAGAGIDVFATEPTTESPLFEHESVVVTPHLGASTDEAQEKAGVAVAKSVRLALGGDLVPDAVNVSGGSVPEEVRPGIALVEKLGRIFTGLAGSVPVQLDVDVKGEITAFDVSIWKLAALKGLFADVTEVPVTYVNAPLLAEQRGCEVRLLTDPTTQDFRNVTTLRGTLADGSTVSVSGTLTGPRLVEKVVGINGFDIEVPLSEHLAFFTYMDRPGVIGTVGRLLGDAQVNIDSMQVARNERGGQALVALTVDSAIPADVLAAIASDVGADVHVVDLAG
ncbi:MAG TPA: phosphoglycerate dehydrogenase, partial [Pedococcus sp.]|nr:phosphoglycerate dehydrogenase [Pedococcus sp.]